MKAFVFLLFSLPYFSVLADGIPFDAAKHRVTVPHMTFALTEAQRLELFSHHHVTLTPSQHERLTKRCPTFPNTIEVVIRYTWNDCTCFSGHPYAILLPGCTSIAVTREEADFVTRYGVRAAYVPPPRAKPKSAWRRFWTTLRGGNFQ